MANDKTEKATPKKKDDARKKGQVAKSADINGAAILLAGLIALSAAAGATTRVQVGLGVVIVPIRPVAWIAKQVASMQLVSNGRVVLGVGVGGDRHDRSWAVSGVPRHERGARTDAALAVLADLIARTAVDYADLPIGMLTALVGGPFFFWLLRRERRNSGGWA